MCIHSVQHNVQYTTIILCVKTQLLSYVQYTATMQCVIHSHCAFYVKWTLLYVCSQIAFFCDLKSLCFVYIIHLRAPCVIQSTICIWNTKLEQVTQYCMGVFNILFWYLCVKTHCAECASVTHTVLWEHNTVTAMSFVDVIHTVLCV